MKPYGWKRQDMQCCPGHFTYPSHWKDRKRAYGPEGMRAKRHAKRVARAEGKAAIRQALSEMERA